MTRSVVNLRIGSHDKPPTAPRRFYTRLCFLIIALTGLDAPAIAHDEHEALPSTGATVYRNRLRITPQAEKALALEKAKVVLDTWRDEVVVNTTVDVPCTRHAYAAALVPGKIAELLARPGDDVNQGQVLARVQSLELEALQAELLQASAQFDLAARTLDQRETLAHSGALPQRDLFIARATYREKVAELALLMAKLRAVGFSPDVLESDERSLETKMASLPISLACLACNPTKLTASRTPT